MKGRNAGKLVCLRNHPEFLSTASVWFGSKWDVPVEAYEESMKECMERKTGIPQWYVVMNGQGAIIAGAGVIENDFHDRKDLAPNLCALFVEKRHRGRGVAASILDFVRKDLAALGYPRLYLVTDLAGFYEKFGWELLTMATGGHHARERLYTAPAMETGPV